jgi:hypothetical protein
MQSESWVMAEVAIVVVIIKDGRSKAGRVIF